MSILGTILIMVIAVAGTLALIIPGIYLIVRLQFWLIPLVLDRANPFAAFGISWDLMQGKWWRTFAIECVLGVIFIVLLLVIAFLGGILVGILIPTLHLQLSTRVELIQAVNAVLYLFIWPLWVSALVAIYKDLKLRRDGSDLAARVSALNPA